MQATDRGWLTVREFASRAGVSQTFVYDSVRDGNLRAIKVRGKILDDAALIGRELDSSTKHSPIDTISGKPPPSLFAKSGASVYAIVAYWPAVINTFVSSSKKSAVDRAAKLVRVHWIGVDRIGRWCYRPTNSVVLQLRVQAI